MQPTADGTIQVRRRIIVGLIFLPSLFGSAAYMNILGDPRFHDISSLDVVRLITIGACWGVAVTGFALLIGSKFRKG